MQYSSLIARASLPYAPCQLKANARSVTTTSPCPNLRSLKSRIVAIRRSHPVAASLSTSLPNGRVRTEIKSDEKPIIVIDNYDSFTYNLCQDEAKSMQQSQHEDVVMEARVRACHGSVLAIHTQDVLFPWAERIHLHALSWDASCFQDILRCGRYFNPKPYWWSDRGSPQETKFTAWMEA